MTDAHRRRWRLTYVATRPADRNIVVPLRRIWPNTALVLVRFAALIFACVSVVPSLPANPGLSPLWRLAGSAGIVLLVIMYVITFARRRTFLAEPALVAVLLVVVGS